MFRPQDVVHPFDRKARENLEQVPLIKTATDKFLKTVNERMMRQYLMSSALRLGPSQLPDIYRLLPPICEAFDIEEPELYLMMGREVNAWTFGKTRTFITLHSSLLEYLDADEIEAVLAHECAHILCDHVLYRSMAGYLGMAATKLPLGDLLSAPIQATLLHWSRMSELSADRAAVAYTGGPETMMRVMLRFAGVLRWARDDQYSIEEFANQVSDYESLMENKTDRLLQTLLGTDSFSTHPLLAVRAAEIQRWGAHPACAKLAKVAAEVRAAQRCVRCGHRPAPGHRHCQHCGQRLSAITSQ